jgi:hypothetical protein
MTIYIKIHEVPREPMVWSEYDQWVQTVGIKEEGFYYSRLTGDFYYVTKVRPLCLGSLDQKQESE